MLYIIQTIYNQFEVGSKLWIRTLDLNVPGNVLRLWKKLCFESLHIFQTTELTSDKY